MKKTNILVSQVIIFSLMTIFLAFNSYAMEQRHTRSDCAIKSHCAICTKDAPYKCKSCKQISYCSVDCQKKHWPNHKHYCKKLIAKIDRSADADSHTEYMRNTTSSEESLELKKEFNDAILKNYLPPFSGDMVWTDTTLDYPPFSLDTLWTGTTCLDYVLFKTTMDFREYILATHIHKIKVSEENNSIPYFKSKNFYFTEQPQENDIIIYFNPSGKAIHFGIMKTSTKVISKPGYLAKSIFIHDIDAYEHLYGKNVKFMRRD